MCLNYVNLHETVIPCKAITPSHSFSGRFTPHDVVRDYFMKFEPASVAGEIPRHVGFGAFSPSETLKPWEISYNIHVSTRDNCGHKAEAHTRNPTLPSPLQIPRRPNGSQTSFGGPSPTHLLVDKLTLRCLVDGAEAHPQGNSRYQEGGFGRDDNRAHRQPLPLERLNTWPGRQSI